MACPQSSLLELLEGRLDVGLQQGLMAHLQECRGCRERLRILAALKAHYARRRQVSKKWGRLMAMAALLMLTLVVRPSHRRPEPVTPVTGPRQPSIFFPLSTRSSPGQSIRTKAFAAYTEGRLVEARNYFEQAPADAEALFFHGMTLYRLQLLEEALEKFRQAGGRLGPWKPESIWYQVQIQLESGKLQEALLLLNDPALKGSSYHDQSLQLATQVRARLEKSEEFK